MNKWLKASLTGVTALGLMAGPALAEEKEKQKQAQEQQEQQQEGTGGAGMQEGYGGAGQQQGKELKGTISKVEGNKLYLETKDGAVVPLQTGNWTQFQGQTPEGQQISSLKQFNEGDEVTASFTPQQTNNRAQSLQLEKAGTQEVSGKVAQTGANQFYLDYEGAMVPINVEKGTKFAGQGAQGKQIASIKDLKPGDEVRASVRVENDTRNVASNIEVTQAGEQGYGGAGQQEGQQESEQKGD